MCLEFQSRPELGHVGVYVLTLLSMPDFSDAHSDHLIMLGKPFFTDFKLSAPGLIHELICRVQLSLWNLIG